MNISSFNFKPGKSLGGKYEITQLVGKGYEGEVYLVRESKTNIERVAKFFFPHRNRYDRTSNSYAKRLHKLSHCSIIVQYHFRGNIRYQGQAVTYIVSEFIEGEMLSDFIKKRPGKRLLPLEALHLLYAIVDGLILVHKVGEFHGDLHTDNVMVKQKGLGYEIRLIDLFKSGTYTKSFLRRDDIKNLAEILYEMIGGKKHYKNMPPQIKYICCGLKQSIILKKFPTLAKLKDHLETLEWD